ncbi:aminoglycoside phosphotransferase family protein [Streptomyces sp. J2-1]|uniref:phosphotransferase family protein n=1 Tax=Streptomyces corallincola TaxID=2851888 RepID=UPI001C38EC59|nr:aminoglycoside phosphotransferase family protein [Streptomyces corallincola]MBV2354256.1 aminoglycoside phosphotransferase family protein [Streptomyces corallincola]
MTQAPTPTADTVRRLVRSLLKESGEHADAAEVRPVTEGRTHTWSVGTRHVLRLAPDREGSVSLRRELRLRELVRPYVPVALPVGVAHAEWAPGLACTLDTRLPGAVADERDVSALGEADLAGLLGGLREVPVRQAETLGVPHAAPRSLEALRRMAVHAAERLAAADEFDPGRLHQLTGPGAAHLATQPGTAVLSHRALTGDHVLVSEDGRVRGALDWSRTAFGDPAEDIAALALAVGSPAAVRAATLTGYGPRPCLRGLWLARCDTVLRLTDHLDGRTPAASPARLRTQLRRAWEPILLERVTELKDEDSLDP